MEQLRLLPRARQRKLPQPLRSLEQQDLNQTSLSPALPKLRPRTLRLTHKGLSLPRSRTHEFTHKGLSPPRCRTHELTHQGLSPPRSRSPLPSHMLFYITVGSVVRSIYKDETEECELWIACDLCDRWFCGPCEGVTAPPEVETYVCVDCRK